MAFTHSAVISSVDVLAGAEPASSAAVLGGLVRNEGWRGSTFAPGTSSEGTLQG